MEDLMKQTLKRISGFFQSSLSSLPNYARMLKIKPLLFKISLVVFLSFFIVAGFDSGSRSKYQNYGSEEAIGPKELYVKQMKDKIYDKLLWEVRTYMEKTAPDSDLDPHYLTQKCIEYNIDIVFVLAQGMLESHLGTKGKAKETNSVWNVGTYDNDRILYRYKDPNESIEPYLELLKKEYLINITSNGDTIYKDLHHLVEDKGYINYKGNRFSSAIGYENSMRKLIIKIDMETSIRFYQSIMQMTPDNLILDQNLEVNYSLLQAMR